MGDTTVVAERIAAVGGNHEFDFSVSDNGVLAYQTGSIQSQLVWFDRSGKKLQTVGDPDTYASVALSPDGRRAAVGMLDADGRNSDMWLLDLLRGSKSRLTFDPKSDGSPIWSPDGTQLVFLFEPGRRRTHTTCLSARPALRVKRKCSCRRILTTSPQAGHATGKAFCSRVTGRCAPACGSCRCQAIASPNHSSNPRHLIRAPQLSLPMVASSHIRQMNRGDGKFTSRAFRRLPRN